MWCLSWDDDEEYGMDVVSYDPVTQTNVAPRKGEIQVAYFSLHDPAEAAEIYADWAHDNRDGWECTWPLKFRVRSEDGSLHDFEVDREQVMEFSASPIEAKT